MFDLNTPLAIILKICYPYDLQWQNDGAMKTQKDYFRLMRAVTLNSIIIRSTSKDQIIVTKMKPFR